MAPDRRLTPARPDLAAAHLKGVVTAERFVEGRTMRIVAPSTPLKRSPAPDAPFETEALMGEAFTLYDEDDEGWAWGQLAGDGYVGWLSANALGVATTVPTHRVTALRTFVYPGPFIKAEPLAALSIGACVAVSRMEGAFAATPAGFIHAGHLAPVAQVAPDFVAVAERFVGVPYLWGGKSSLGIDCSGLVQLALMMAGMAAPRDSDLQEAGLGVAVDLTQRRRGDCVFWKGHVGIMTDAETLLHANGHHMMVVCEPLETAMARIAAAGAGPVTAVRRLPHYTQA